MVPSTEVAMSSHSITAATLTLLLAGSPAEQHQHGSTEKLGVVQFQTSCNAAAEPLFNRAVALLHSFGFGRAIDAFNATLKADPACAMAEWGVALSRWGNPFSPSLRAAGPLQQGRDAVNRAKAIGPKTTRERDYIEAVAQLYASFETVDQRSREIGR